MLADAFSRCNIAFPKPIRPLPGEDRVVIRGGQGVRQVRLDSQPVAAVLGLTVYGIAGDTDGLRLLQDKAGIISASASPCG